MKGYISESLLILMQSIPYSDISICQIAEKAGVNRSTYYRHFTSKESIIKYYYQNLLSEFRQYYLELKTTVKLEHYLECMFSFFLNHKKYLLLLHQHKLSYLLLDSLNVTFTENIRNKESENLFSIYYHVGGIFNNFNLWFDFKMEQTPEKMAKISMKSLPDNFYPMLIEKQ